MKPSIFGALSSDTLIVDALRVLRLRGSVIIPVFVIVVIPVPTLVDKLIPVPATKLPPTLPVRVLALIVPDADILLTLIFIVLMVDALITLTLRGEVTNPVFVIVVTPPTVLRLMPAPAAKLFEILPLRVGAVMVVEAFTLPQVMPNRTFIALSILALIAERLLVLTFLALMFEVFNSDMVLAIVALVMLQLIILALVIPAFVAIKPLGPTTVRFLMLAESRTSNSRRVVVSDTMRSLTLTAEKLPNPALQVVSTAKAMTETISLVLGILNFTAPVSSPVLNRKSAPVTSVDEFLPINIT